MQFNTSTLLKILAIGTILAIFLTVALSARPAADGGDLFKQKCSMCHGPDGKGYPALKTPDFTDPKVQAALSDKEITEAIKNGKKGTAMPPFGDKLSDDQIHALVTYIRSLGKSK